MKLLLLLVVLLVGCAKSDPITTGSETVIDELYEITEQLNQLPPECGDVSTIQKTVDNAVARVEMLKETCQLETDKLENEKQAAQIWLLIALVAIGYLALCRKS